MSGESEAVEQTTLMSVAADFLARDSRYKSMTARTYSLDARAAQHFTSLISGGTGDAPSAEGHPVLAMLADIGERKVVRWISILCWKDGPRFVMHGAELDVPDGSYLIIASPNIADGTPEEMSKASTGIGSMVGTLGCFLGRSIIFDLVTEVEVWPDGRDTSASEVMRVPQDWDNVSFPQSEPYKELMLAIKSADKSKRDRVLFGLSTVSRALLERDERFRVLEYWIAMEVLADGLQSVVTRELASAYGEQDKFALDELELRAAIRLRADIVHHGKGVTLAARFERLLQCYCLDLARHHLGLQCGRYSESVANFES